MHPINLNGRETNPYNIAAKIKEGLRCYTSQEILKA